MMKPKTIPAQVAAKIRSELKTSKIKSKVKVEAYGLEAAVSIVVFDISPSQLKGIHDFCKTLEYFNSKSHKTFIESIDIDVQFSESLKQKAWLWIRKNFDENNNMPNTFDDPESSAFQLMGYQAHEFLLKILKGDSQYKDFWNNAKS